MSVEEITIKRLGFGEVAVVVHGREDIQVGGPIRDQAQALFYAIRGITDDMPSVEDKKG